MRMTPRPEIWIGGGRAQTIGPLSGTMHYAPGDKAAAHEFPAWHGPSPRSLPVAIGVPMQ
jgi:hypothetical protein